MAQKIDPDIKYYISAAAYQDAYIASTSDYSLTLATQDATPGVSSPLQFTISPAESPYYNICANLTAGTFCMDQWGNNATQPALQKPGSFSGQQWTLTSKRWDNRAVWQLQSLFAGSENYLSAFGVGIQTLALVPITSVDDTYFELIDASSNPSTTTNTLISGPTGTNTIPNSPSTASPSSSTSSANVSAVQPSGSSSSLSSISTGAIAGIVVGVIAAFVAVMVLVYCLWWRKRAARQAPTTVESGAHLTPNSASTTFISKSKFMPPGDMPINSAKSRGPTNGLHELPSESAYHELGAKDEQIHEKSVRRT